ncbi:MAG: beta-lactamase family protein [Treponema sp.]|nr:beta-lactamase family protein [Treponema sp.]
MKIFKAFLILIFSFIFLSCSTTLYRAMTRGDAGVDDYLYFPERKIAAGGVVREIRYEPDSAIEDRLEELFETGDLQSFIDKTKTQALLVVRGDSLVFEAYGKDYGRESVVTSFSVAKSFVCAIVGVLLQQGKIKSVDQPVIDFIPELIERDKRFSKIRLCDLLSMSSGIAYSERAFDDTKTYYDPDLRKLALTKTKIKSEPDTEFLYNNYNPLLLGIVIERASGTSVSAFLEEYIWKPMGAEFDASWSLDSIEDGFEKMESGINARAIDFARFGCLYRDEGTVNANQLIPKDWITESVKDHHSEQEDFYCDDFGTKIKNTKNGGWYSYFWYGLKREGFGQDDFFAAGNKSQIIYISKKTDMVIVRFGEKDGIDFWDWISKFYDLVE